MVIGFQTSSDSWEFNGIYHQLDRDTMTLWYLMIFGIWLYLKMEYGPNFSFSMGTMVINPWICTPWPPAGSTWGRDPGWSPSVAGRSGTGGVWKRQMSWDGNWREVLNVFIGMKQLILRWKQLIFGWAMGQFDVFHQLIHFDFQKPWMKGMKLHTGTITVTMGVCIPSEGDGIIQ